MILVCRLMEQFWEEWVSIAGHEHFKKDEKIKSRKICDNQLVGIYL